LRNGVTTMAYQSTDQAALEIAGELGEMFRALEALPIPQRLLSLLDELEAEEAMDSFEAALPRAVGF
jgi:hypothetical protein